MRRAAAAIDTTITIAIASAGLSLVGAGFHAARGSRPYADGVYWLGLSVILVSCSFGALVLARRGTGMAAWIIFLGAVLYGIKVLREPHLATHDELAHLRTLRDVSHGRFFADNPVLPISARYPGLELITAGVMKAFGTSPYLAAVAVIGTARLVLLLSLFLLFARLIGNDRAAALACLIYVCNPTYLYWSAQFAYESLALPLAVSALAVAVTISGRHSRAAVLCFLAAALIVTHHLTLWWFVVVSCAWAIAERRSASHTRIAAPHLATGFAIAGSAAWAATVAPGTLNYLLPVFTQTSDEALAILSGAGHSRELFATAAYTTPLWQSAVSVVSVVVTCLLLLGSTIAIRRERRDPLFNVLWASGLLYPLFLLARFTARGQEISNRTSEFLYVGIALAVAAAFSSRWRIQSLGRRLVLIPLVLLLFVGGVIVGWAPYDRMPGPYLVEAGDRSVDPINVAAATWITRHVPPNSRFATDRMNGALIGSLGEHPVNAIDDGVDPTPIFTAPIITPSVMQLIYSARIHFLLVDTRLANSFPYDGVYIEQGEHIPRPGRMRRSWLTKFDSGPYFQQIYSRGGVAVYAVKRNNHRGVMPQ